MKEKPMRIKIGLIPSEYANNAQELSLKLQSAVEIGEMIKVDQITEELISLIDKEYSLSLSEKSWHLFIEKIRTFDKGFISDYLIVKPQLEIIIASDVSKLSSDAVSVFEHALNTNGIVLQIPFEEEITDV